MRILRGPGFKGSCQLYLTKVFMRPSPGVTGEHGALRWWAYREARGPVLCPQPQSILIADHLPKTPSCRLQSELVASTGKTALLSLSRDGDPARLASEPKITKFLPGKPVPMIPPRYPSSLRRPQAGISPTKEHMGLILARLHLLCLPEDLAARATNR